MDVSHAEDSSPEPFVLRFHLDEHVANAIAAGLRRRGRDCTTTPEAGLLSASDEEQVAYCQTEGRVIVTSDADFCRLLAARTDHPGMIFWTTDRSLGQVVNMIDELAFNRSAVEMRGQIVYV